jgi:hypothetical protein
MKFRKKTNVLLGLFSVFVLFSSLLVATFMVQTKTRLLNKAATDYCSQVIINSPDRMNYCNSLYLPGLGYGCRSITYSCNGIYDKPTCDLYLSSGCTWTLQPSSCSGFGEAYCNKPGCSYVKPHCIDKTARTSTSTCNLKLTQTQCQNLSAKNCTWYAYGTCLGQYTEGTCSGGNYALCKQQPVVCTPGGSYCSDSKTLKRCDANGTQWTTSSCANSCIYDPYHNPPYYCK